MSSEALFEAVGKSLPKGISTPRDGTAVFEIRTNIPPLFTRLCYGVADIRCLRDPFFTNKDPKTIPPPRGLPNVLGLSQASVTAFSTREASMMVLSMLPLLQLKSYPGSQNLWSSHNDYVSDPLEVSLPIVTHPRGQVSPFYR